MFSSIVAIESVLSLSGCRCFRCYDTNIAKCFSVTVTDIGGIAFMVLLFGVAARGDDECFGLLWVLNGERAVVSTLAGGVSGVNGGYSDANGTNAGFSFPHGSAVDASGNVYVADAMNQRIRKMTVGGGTRIGPTIPHFVCSLCGHTALSSLHRLRPASMLFVAGVAFDAVFRKLEVVEAMRVMVL